MVPDSNSACRFILDRQHQNIPPCGGHDVHTPQPMPDLFFEPSMVIQFRVIDHHPASGATAEMIQKKTIVSRRKRHESFLRVVGGPKFLGSNRPARGMIDCQPLSGNAHGPPIGSPDAEVPRQMLEEARRDPLRNDDA